MARAENALEQLRKHGKDRTVAFCVSQRHADFMAAFFREEGLRAVAAGLQKAHPKGPHAPSIPGRFCWIIQRRLCGPLRGPVASSFR
jgi:hypothetical protein